MITKYYILKKNGNSVVYAAECRFVIVPYTGNTFEESVVSFTRLELDNPFLIRPRFDWDEVFVTQDEDEFTTELLNLNFSQEVIDLAFAEPRGPLG